MQGKQLEWQWKAWNFNVEGFVENKDIGIDSLCIISITN